MNATQHLPVHFIRTTDAHGCACYFVLQGKPSDIRRLQSQRGAVTLTDYGTILESGFDHTPLPEVCARLKAQYGLDIPTE